MSDLDEYAAKLQADLWGVASASMTYLDRIADENDAAGERDPFDGVVPVFAVRFSREQFARVRRAARLAGKSTEAWISTLVLGEADLAG